MPGTSRLSALGKVHVSSRNMSGQSYSGYWMQELIGRGLDLHLGKKNNFKIVRDMSVASLYISVRRPRGGGGDGEGIWRWFNWSSHAKATFV